MGRKIALSVLMILFAVPFSFGQSEMLKGIVTNMAYYSQRKDLKNLIQAKRSVDSLLRVSLDTNNLEKNVYRALINGTILYMDTTNATGQPENFFRKTVEQVDILLSRKKIFKYQAEMDFVKQCLANVYIRKAFDYVKISDYPNASALFLKAHKYAPAFKELNAYVAFTNNKLGNLTGAAKYYDNLIKTDTARTDYIEAASNVYKAVGDTTKAIEILRRGRRLLPGDKFLILDEANIYNNRKDYASLEPLLPQLLDFNINNPDIVLVAANCYDHLHQYDKAESLYLHVIELNSSAYDPIFNLGLLYLKKSTQTKGADNTRNLSRAQQWVEKANEISPNDQKCLEVLQLIYAQTGNKEQENKINNKLKQITNQ